jgi:GAF domain-containing protein
VPPAEIFRAVAEEVGPLLGADDAAVVRFEPDRAVTVMAGAGGWVVELERQVRVELDDSLAITEVFRTGGSTRVDERDYSTASGPVATYLHRVQAHLGGCEPDRRGRSTLGGDRRGDHA